MEIAGIYTEFHQSLLSFVRSKIRSREDAEDILQNIFIKISGNADSLSEKVDLKSWLFTVAKNAVIDYYRIKSKKRDVEFDDTVSENFVDEGSIDPTKGLDGCVGTMINLLPEEYRTIVTDAEVNGIRQKDLAEKYNMPYPSMRSRVQRGRERLKQLLYNCCHIETDRRGNVLEAEGRRDCAGPCKPCPEAL
jgi:RNA polymerase sigma-70 factor (ECF subfamily)